MSEIQVSKFVIPGDPTPWARARFGNGRFYDSQRHQKMLFAVYLEQQRESRDMFSGPIALDISFCLRIPPCYKNKRASMLNTFHGLRPDLDNLLKFMLDAATGVLFGDDCIVSSIMAKKLYSEDPRTEFTITPLLGKYDVKA